MNFSINSIFSRSTDSKGQKKAFGSPDAQLFHFFNRAFLCSKSVKPLEVTGWFFLLSHRFVLNAKLVIAILLISGIFSCTPTEVSSEDELLNYIRDEDHGVHLTLERNGIDVSLMYRPTDLVVHQELQGKDQLTKQEVEELYNRYNNYAYFVLSYSQNDREALYAQSADYADFSEKLQRIAFRMGENAFMTTQAKDTVYLSDYYYPRMHGMGMATQVLLAFEREKIMKNEYTTLHVKDLGLGTGRVNFKIKTKDLDKVPAWNYYREIAM